MNSPRLPEHLEPFYGYRLAYVDASGIASHNDLGTRTHPIINTAMIGAFARVLDMPSLDAIVMAIENEIPVKPRQNGMAAQEAYANVHLYGPVKND
jgi:pyruvate ferredoxin oxidoreductase gamma subunit/2-oxoisovalerate ferredoxin oxidoreductase gamma subunit